ncbi:MAG: Crp/Fnr family transcriptional regulator [Myxococcota bacterium]
MDTLLNLLREIKATPIDQREARFADRSLVGRAGQRLYRADEPVDEIYILVSGYARAYVGERGNGRTTLLMCGPAILGDREVLAGSTARDSVRLLTPGHLISIPREDFLNEWFSSAELRAWITRDLVGRYASSLSWFALETSSLADRLSGLLGVLASLGLPVRALAAVLGVSERSVFRALAELRARPSEEKEEKEETSLMYSLIAEPTKIANSENAWNERTDEFEVPAAQRLAI